MEDNSENTQENNQDKEQSLIAHLEEFRDTLIACLRAVAIVLPFAFWVSPKVLDLFVHVLTAKNNIALNYFAPMEVFFIQLKIALLIDVVVCFPYIAKKLWDFILPALYDNERKFIRSFVVASSFLFFAGVAFCLFLILPVIINFGMSFAQDNIKAMFGVSNIINLSLQLALVFGLMFQIPLAINLLIRWDIIEYEFVSDKRPYVVVLLLIVAALLTPPDIISQTLLFIPTYILFELGLFFSRNSKKKQNIDPSPTQQRLEKKDE